MQKIVNKKILEYILDIIYNKIKEKVEFSGFNDKNDKVVIMVGSFKFF